MRGSMPRLLIVLALCGGLLGGCELTMSPAERTARAAKALDEGRVGSAIVDLKKVLQKNPDASAARLLLVRAELSGGDVPAAVADLGKVDRAAVDAAQYERLHWEVALAARDYERMARELAVSRAGLPDVEREFLLARAQAGLGRADLARPLLERVVRADAGNDRARAELGRSIAAAEGPDAGLRYLRAEVERAPRSAALQRALADALQRSGDFGAAEAAYRSALAALPAEGEMPVRLATLGGLADALVAQRKLDDADAVATEVAKLAPDAGISFLLRGRVAAARRDYPAAVQNFQKLVNADPSNTQIRTMLAAVQLEQGSAEQAISNLERALAAAPGNAVARRMLAQALLARGRSEDADRLLADAEGAKQTPDLQIVRARAILASGDRAGASALLAQVGARGDLNDDLRLELAAAWLDARQPEKALGILNQTGGPRSNRANRLRLVALAAKDRVAGADELRKYLAAHADDPAELQFAAFALASLGDSATALAALQRYASAHSGDASAWLALAQVQGRVGRIDDAQVSLKRVLDLGPNLDAELGMSRIAAREGREDDAIAWLERARTTAPRAIPPREQLVRALLASRRPEPAVAVVKELVDIDPTRVEARLLGVAVALARNDAGAALEAAKEAVRIAPASSAAWLAKGQVHVRLKQGEEARVSLRKAIALAPTAAAPLVALARLELADGNPTAALSLARRTQERKESIPLGLALEGEVLLAAQRPAEAITVFEKLQEAAPAPQVAISQYRARLAAKAPDPQQPLARWLGAHPRDTGVRIVLAEHWQRAGQRAKAIAEYEQGLAVEPDSALIGNNLAWLYSEAGDPRALATARRALAQAPGNAAIKDTLGLILVRAGQRDEGIALLREAAAAAPAAADVQFHLASALAQNGDAAGARAIARRFTGADVPAEVRARFQPLAR